MKVTAPAKVAICAVILALVCVFGIHMWFLHHKMVACERHDQVIDQSNEAYMIVRTDTACDGIASSYDVSLNLVSDGVKRTTILEYGDGSSFAKSSADSEPVVRWIDEHTLMIEVGTVAYMRSMKQQAGSITIKYRIGKVMFES